MLYCSTSLEMLKTKYANEYKERKIRLNDKQRKIFEGFLSHLDDFVTSVPSEGDIKMLSEAYYRSKYFGIKVSYS